MFAELPDLEGSEKQVAWAGSIREKLLKSIETKLTENRLIDFVDRNDEIASAIKTANQKRTSAQWWINNREITGDCLISVALLNLGLITNGKAFRVREVYREKTKRATHRQGVPGTGTQPAHEWIVTREAENNNWVLPVFLKNNLTLKSAERFFIVEQWGANLERVGATTNPPQAHENLKIFSFGDALDKSRNNNSGWPSRELGLVVLKYSFSYPALAAPYFNCYGVSR